MTEPENSTLNKTNDNHQLIIISGCFDCPFNYEYDMAISAYGCRIDTQNRTITPKWCPVKKGSVVIKYDS